MASSRLQKLSRAACLGVILAAGALPVAACGRPDGCSPEVFGFQAPRVVVRSLASLMDRGCTGSAARIIGASAELEALETELGASFDDDASTTIDFSTERVVAFEHSTDVAISWSIVSGNALVVGLLGCATTTSSERCTVDVVRVPATFSAAETRTCDAVMCGTPPR